MLITITIISVIVVAGVVWLANKILPFTICPICAGVFLTWVWLIGAHIAGYQIDLIIPALLMGGSVVGVVYQLEKKFRDLPVGRVLLWKILFIPTGFVVAYGILERLPAVFLLAVIFLFLASLLLIRKTNTHNKAIDGLEKKMEECC